MIFDFSDKINQHGLKVIFSNAEESNILTKKTIVSMSQIHSTNIEVVNNKKIVYKNVDGIFSSNKNYALKVKTADCLPIFFIHEHENIFGVIHAGWKGLKNGIISKSTKLLSSHINDLNEITVLIGPSISQKNYEVKNEFIDYFGNEFIDKVGDKFFCNLKGVASSQLQKLGVKNIIDCNQCTYENENYHSYRRNKTSKRMIGLIYYE
jgi:YfiH family protein